MVFVRSVCRHGVKVSLWTRKCCVAPVKLTTVPRLELLVCVLLPKLIVSLYQQKRQLQGCWMFEMYFVGQICRFHCGGSDRFGKIGKFGLKIEFRLFGKMQARSIECMCWLILIQRMLPLGCYHQMFLLVVRCGGKVHTFFTWKILICNARTFWGCGKFLKNRR